MTLVDASVLLISVFFALYGLSSAIECGLMLKMLARDSRSRTMFTPLWEVTNVFLVFGFTALAMLFNGALGTLSHALIATLSVALFTMLARACLVLGIFYIRDDDKIGGFLTWLLAVGTYLVALSFSAAGIYLLSGADFYHTLLGSLLMLATFVGLSGVGLILTGRSQAQRKLVPAELVLALWYLLLGCVVPLAVTHSGSLLNQKAILALSILAGLGLALMLMRAMGFRAIKVWQFTALASLVVPVLLAWSNRPFLISGQLRLSDAFGASSYGRAVVAGLIIMLPLMAVGGWLFVKLLPRREA